MQIFQDVRQANISGPTWLTIGNFDGLHRGHQVLLETLQEQSNQGGNKGISGILTFEPHPLSVLQPDRTIKLLTTPQERVTLADHLGIDIGIVQPFDSTFAALDVRDFLMLFKRHLGLAGLVVGPDFAMGRGRSGDIHALYQLSTELDFELIVLSSVDFQDKSIRSSAIRQFLIDGEVENASTFLGRNYHLAGVVEMGDQRGRQIGVPTANLRADENKLLPRNGVYATRTWIVPESNVLSSSLSSATLLTADLAAQRAPVFNSVTNLGIRPTVDGHSHRIETHLLDFPPQGISSNLYGQTLVVEFFRRFRDEKRFSGLEALIIQIQADIKQARKYFWKLNLDE